MNYPAQAAKHHWWPRGLSKFWKDDAGMAHRVSWDGELETKPPKSFGHTRNDNNVTLGVSPTPWDFSFEHTFQEADDAFPRLVEWLRTLSSPIRPTDVAFAHRMTPIALSDAMHATLAKCCASLIVRSPSLRSQVRLSTEDLRKRIGLRDFSANKSLVGMNVRGGQAELTRAIDRGGKFAVLLAGEQEFIFGDGFMHNVASVTGPIHSPSFLLPLTPEIAVFYTRPSSYRSYPKAFVMNLTSEEVAFVNLTVQVYSARHLFFREIYPVIDDAFTRGEHLQFEYHRHTWTTALGETMANAYFEKDRFLRPTNSLRVAS